MIQTPVLSQRDSRWSWKTLGFSTGTIGNYGCLITCLTMIAKEGDVSATNDKMKQFGDYAYGNYKSPFYSNLVVWANVPNAIPSLKFVERLYTYDNEKAKNWLAKGYPVIVQVDGAPIGAPYVDHYIILVGDQKCVDPWTGKVRPTTDFPLFKGMALYITPITDVYEEKLKTLKVAVDRLKSELDTDSASANKEVVYKNTMNKIKRVYDTGTL